MREPINNRSPTIRDVIAAWIVCLLIACVGITFAGEVHARHIAAQPKVASVGVPPRHFGQIRNPASCRAPRPAGAPAQSRQPCPLALAAEGQNRCG